MKVDLQRYKSTVKGFGINDADYPVNKEILITDEKGNKKRRSIFRCPYYDTWQHMLARCYCDKLKANYPTYKDVTVCEEWLTFSNFKSWMETQDWEGKHLDKDLLVDGNKIYSPETCCFLDQRINSFITESKLSKNNLELPVGVCIKKGYTKKKYVAQINNPIAKKYEHIGYFYTAEEAHLAWLEKKLLFAKALAATIDDQRIADALIRRYTK